MVKVLSVDMLFSNFLFLPFSQIRFALLIADFKVLIIVRIIVCVLPRTVHSSSSILSFLSIHCLYLKAYS